MEASIYDYELVEPTGGRISCDSPAQAKYWNQDMHTCIVIQPAKSNALLVGYRILTTNSIPNNKFALGKLVELGTLEKGSIGTWRVIGFVNLATMSTVGQVPISPILHWILK